MNLCPQREQRECPSRL